MELDILETRGVAALRRLYLVACRDSGQCRYIARFLLGLYNGSRFPFDLTDLRAIDTELFDDCMAVLNMDARITRQEVHTYFEDGGAKFEQLAKRWGVEDFHKLRQDAARASQPAGSPAPVHQGGWYPARFVTHAAAPGYRDVALTFAIGEAPTRTSSCNSVAPIRRICCAALQMCRPLRGHARASALLMPLSKRSAPIGWTRRQRTGAFTRPASRHPK